MNDFDRAVRIAHNTNVAFLVSQDHVNIDWDGLRAASALIEAQGAFLEAHLKYMESPTWLNGQNSLIFLRAAEVASDAFATNSVVLARTRNWLKVIPPVMGN